MNNLAHSPTEPLSARPTRVRYIVVMLAVLLAMVTYLDRACISVLKADIADDLGLTDRQMGYVFSAFALAYALFEIPTAWWADRRGTRRVLTRIVVWWSAFTQIGSLISPVLVIELVQRLGNWNAPLYLMGILFLVGAMSWLLVDPRRRVFD